MSVQEMELMNIIDRDNRIEKLEQQLAQQQAMLDEAIKVIEFYGTATDRLYIEGFALFGNPELVNDVSYIEEKRFPLMGERARTFLEKVKEKSE